MTRILRFEVNFSRCFRNLNEAHKIAKICMAKGYKPVYSLTVEYEGGLKRCYVDLVMKNEEEEFIEGFKVEPYEIYSFKRYDKYFSNRIESNQDLMRHTKQSKFEQYYHEKDGLPDTMKSPFCGASENTLYQNASSDKISYEQLNGWA